MTENFARIVVNRTLEDDKVFDYIIPAKLNVKVGMIVKIPFGHQDLEGIVVEITNKTEVPKEKLKEITSIISEQVVFSNDLLELAKYLSDYYLCPYVSVLQAMLPAGINYTGSIGAREKVYNIYLNDLEYKGKNDKQKALLNCILANPPMTKKDLMEKANVSASVVKNLLDKNIIELREVSPFEDDELEVENGPNLVEAQENALRIIHSEYENKNRPVLLNGVTGSGKTEVYLQLTEEVIRKGKQVILLVPEIALTSQLVAVFKNRIKSNICLLHSGLSVGERRKVWLGIASGHYQVVIGARSAIFAPVQNLGLVIVDEEHDQSYKQDSNPRFHGVNAAIFRAKQSNSICILGSATPSIESYYKCKNGEFAYVEMANRIGGRDLAKAQVVNMSGELKRGNNSPISRLLYDKITETLYKNEQVILFLNRRGYDSFVSCRSCGYTVECPHCSIAMSYHLKENRLKCHYCGRIIPVPNVCPNCGSKAIRHFGAGTEKIAEQVKKMFPNARVGRIDRDVVNHKGAMDRIFNQMKAGEIDILIGTQLIAKGWDLPNVTLVGVLAADMSLNLPDFRAGERTYQLLTQVAGRSGRHKPGEVIIQTYQPENPIINYGIIQDYDLFYSYEVGKRELCDYPPFTKIIRLIISAYDNDIVDYGGNQIADLIRSMAKGEFDIWGASPCPYSKIKDRYRVQVLLKGNDLDKMRSICKNALRKWKEESSFSSKIMVNIDVEPLNMM